MKYLHYCPMNIELLSHPYPGNLLAMRLQKGFELLTAPGQGSTDWFLFYSLAGSGNLLFSNGQLELARGTLICCVPGIVPALCATTGEPLWDLVLVRFCSRPEWRDWLKWPQHAPGVGLLEVAGESDRKEIERSLELLVVYQQESGRWQDALSANMLERVLLLGQKQNLAVEQPHTDPRIARAIKEIQSMPKTELDINRLANIANVSSSRFSHLFREQTGISPQQYVENQRMQMAKRLLLNSRRQIQDIANEVGYDDSFYFSTRFKRQWGMSPRQWRKAMTRKNA